MRSRPQDIPALPVCHDAAHGQTARDSLGKGAHIRHNAVLLESKEAARPAHAGLHLVHQQQPVVLLAQSLDSLDVFLVQRQHAALSLHQLQHDGAHIVSGGRLQGLHGVGVRIAEALGKREEILVELILSGGGQRRNRAAVEGVVQRDDGGTALAVLVEAVLSRQLDHTLVGLAAAVGKEHVAHAGALAENLRQPGAGLRVKEVGGVAQLFRLRRDGIHPGLIAVAQVADADAACKVDVFPALRAVKSGSFPVIQRHGKTAVGVHDVLAVQRLDRFACHTVFSFSSMVPMPSSLKSSIRMEWGMRPSRI